MNTRMHQISPIRLPILTILLTLLALMLTGNGFAADPVTVTKNMQTTLGLYFTPSEAYQHMQKHGDRTLFIDVRDPIEVNFTGMPSVADVNVPFKFADITKFNTKKKQFNMITNKNFVADVDKQLAMKNLTKSDTVIVMCRSGPRSAKAANALAKAGYTKVYNLIEGFEGAAVNKGPKKGQRTIDGWKNANLPWDTPKGLDINKMYGHPVAIVPKKKS